MLYHFICCVQCIVIILHRRSRRVASAQVSYRLLHEGGFPSDSEDERFEDSDDDQSYVPERTDRCFQEESDIEEEIAEAESVPSGSSAETGGMPRPAKAKKTWHWVKRDLPRHEQPENQLRPRGRALSAETPYQMFSTLFDDELLDTLVLETNRYKATLGGRTKPFARGEIETALGIALYMSVSQLPARRMYWSAKTRQATVADAMTVNRFEEVLSYIHVADNNLMKSKGQPGFDNLHKVRPLIRKLNKNMDACAEPELFVSIDEQIIPFKGRHSLKVYMKSKPRKWGYKLWVKAGKSGYVHSFVFDRDTTTPQLEKELVDQVGKPGEVVLRFLEGQPSGSYFFFDNYFSCPELFVELNKRNMYATATIRSNRMRNCPLRNEKSLKKDGRGTVDYVVSESDGILQCAWYDNRQVTLISNVHGVQPMQKVKRYDKKQGEFLHVDCPYLVTEYNACMGGVDRVDMLLALYRVHMKSRKWYKRVLFHLIDLAVVNAWYLYRAVDTGTEKAIDLVNFKLDIALAMIQKNRSVSASRVPAPLTCADDARFDGKCHFGNVEHISHGMRCKLEGCTSKTKMRCLKCNVYLCLSAKSNCFLKYHSK